MSSVESPLPEGHAQIPQEYAYFTHVFSKVQAFGLPLHHPLDCAMEMEEGLPWLTGCLYTVSHPEEEAMRMYVKEALTQGIIYSSTTPTSSGFFYVKKKDGGLRPCIDYRRLNAITGKH